MRNYKVEYIPLHGHPDNFGEFREANYETFVIVEANSVSHAIKEAIQGNHISKVTCVSSFHDNDCTVRQSVRKAEICTCKGVA